MALAWYYASFPVARQTKKMIESLSVRSTVFENPVITSTAGYYLYFASFDSSFSTVPAPCTTKPVTSPNDDLTIRWIVDTLDHNPSTATVRS